jgi:hypothetical protein
VNELRLSDPVAQRVGRFFADLMLTLIEDGDRGVATAETVAALWLSPSTGVGPAHLERDAQTLVHGIGAVAAMLAEELTATRRAHGAPDATAADAWREVVTALAATPGGGAGSDAELGAARELP